MQKMTKLRRNALLTLLGLAGLLLMQQVSAMQCRFGNATGSSTPSGGVSQNIDIGRPVVIAASDFVANNIVWRSQNLTSTFTCWDTNGMARSEHAYIYWNPKNGFGALDPSLAVGVSINGMDYDAINHQQSTERPTGPDLGMGIIGIGGSTAQPQAITINYSVYIKATGIRPPAGNLAPLAQASLFQIDGGNGLNPVQGQAFNAYLKGLDKIRVVQCNPQISVTANSGSSVDFGSLNSSGAKPGVVAKQVPFNIKATLTGGECAGQSLQASFSSTNTDPGNDAYILPATRPGVAIYLTKQGDLSGTPIPMQTTVDFGHELQEKQTEVTETFLAHLKWLTDNPKPGIFSATANVDVTFK